MNIALFKYDMNGRMTAQNGASRAVLRRVTDDRAAARSTAQTADAAVFALHGEAGHPRTATPKLPGRGWWGRNWTAAVAVFCVVGTIVMAIPNRDGELEEGVGAVIFYAVVAVFAGLAWLVSAQRRQRWRRERGTGLDVVANEILGPPPL